MPKEPFNTTMVGYLINYNNKIALMKIRLRQLICVNNLVGYLFKTSGLSPSVRESNISKAGNCGHCDTAPQ